MTDIARIMNGFGGHKSEFLNASDKTITILYKYVRDKGQDMSVVKLSSRGNLKSRNPGIWKNNLYTWTTYWCSFYFRWNRRC